MAESFHFSITSLLIRKLSSPLLQKFGSCYRVKKDLKKLLIIFTSIQSMLKDVDEQQWSNNAIRDWLDKLKDVAYDIEDILDEIETENLRYRVEIQGRTANKVREFFTPSNPAAFKFKMKRKIRKVVEQLDEIAKEKKNYSLSKRPIDRRNGTRTKIQTHSYIHESDVLGREDERENLVQLLIDMGNEEEENVSIIPIVGMGGLGKTTLTKLIYNDDRVESYFDQRMWAFVSENFDLVEIMRAIITSANDKERCDLEHMDPLQSHLRKILDGKKYLLVLDDVWNENQEEWLQLKALLNVGARGSRILVTTCSMNVASVMGMRWTHELKELPEDACWSLFKQRAFPQRDEQSYPNLLDIGKQIVNRCKRVPLAIKALGGLLHNERRESYWLHVKDDEIWKLNDNAILLKLKLSYNHLPSCLKQCFTFFGVFPKGYNFEKDTLIQIWMAEGFIQSVEDGKLMEDIGIEYFDELCCRSFLQEVPNNVTFKLHDLIHDLARSIGQSESSTVEEGRIEGVTKRTRHLSVDCASIDRMSFHNAKKLRTFIMFGVRHRMLEVSNVISSLTWLRVLDLSWTSIKTLPNSIEKLKHLKYLNLSHTPIEILLESICSLKSLQTLKLLYCHRLQKLPNDMWKMIRLRHLEINCFLNMVRMPYRIGELRDLQTLPIFIVENERGHGIDELQGLNLRGELEIRNLQNVLNPLDAEKVKLREKKNLHSLHLSWGGHTNKLKAAEIENHEHVIESLQPHSNVRKLSVTNYMGTKFPRWLMLLEFPDLVEVSFIGCRRCEILPPLWQLQHLQVLTIVNMPNLEKFLIEETRQVLPKIETLAITSCPKLFTRLPHLPSLQHLELIGCNEMLLMSLEACPAITSLKIGGFSEMTSLPEWLLKNKSRLKSLSIRNCPKLKSLSMDSHDLAAIETLKFDDCGEIESLLKEIHNLTSLVSFTIWDCSKLQLLPGEVFRGLTSLHSIHVNNCANLRSLGEGLQHLNALTDLKVYECPELTSLPESLDKLTALETLYMIDLPKLASLPKEIGNLTSLKTLRLYSCPKLLSLPESLQKVTTLEHLSINECPILERRCDRDKGMDWHKIAHVPSIFINRRKIDK